MTWLQKVQKSFERAVLPTPEDRIELFQLAVESLTSVGYCHIGLDHFALPEDELNLALQDGTLHRNFMGYTTRKGASLLGFGASAISTLKQGFSQNEKDPTAYNKLIGEREFATVKGYARTAEDLWRADLIEQVLCSGTVNFQVLQRTHRGVMLEIPANLNQFVDDGLIELEKDGFKLTELGRYFSRNIAALFDEYLTKHTSKNTFSQAV